MEKNILVQQKPVDTRAAKEQELLAEFKGFWAKKDQEHPLTRILNLCFKPMEPRLFCTIWVPIIWPYIETPSSDANRLPKYFLLASEILLGKVLSMDGVYLARWVRNPDSCTSNLAKLHLRAVHIIWSIHFFIGFPSHQNILSEFASFFQPVSASAFRLKLKKHKL